MTPTVYILCGIQFSGKTSLAHSLASKFGWAHVAVDEIAESLLNSGQSEVTEDQWAEAFTTSCKQITASLGRGQSVVYDATNFERITRDQIRAIAHQSGASAHVIYFAVPVEEADRRRIANQVQPQRHDVSDAGFWELVESLEPPTEDEAVLVFDGKLDVETWIECFIGEAYAKGRDHSNL